MKRVFLFWEGGGQSANGLNGVGERAEAKPSDDIHDGSLVWPFQSLEMLHGSADKQ